MQCPKCGYVLSELDPECLRCRRGGQTVTAAPAQNAPQNPTPNPTLNPLAAEEKECPRCGKAAQAGATQCDKCGYEYRPDTSQAERYQALAAEEARVAPPPALKRSVSPLVSWSAIGLCLAAALGGGWAMLGGTAPVEDASAAAPIVLARHHRPRGTKPVTYKVTGASAQAVVTFRGADGTMVASPSAVALPWTQTVDARPGAVLSLSAIPADSGTGGLRCEIDVEGKARKQATTPDKDGMTVVSDKL